ncbi:MAG: iron ABC transporter permease [bacterium]|nr:iron ABC transporter permease [bacterium]
MEEKRKEKKRKNRSLYLFLFLSLILLTTAFFWSVCTGAREIRPSVFLEALTRYDAANVDHVIIRTLRLPRTVVAAAVGASLAVSGTLMQATTRNPMASPSVLGINAGAGLGLALAMVFVPGASFNQTVLFSFAGAAVGTVTIFGIASASRAGSSPVRLALVGTAISSLFSACSQAVAMYFKISQDLTFWNAGGVSGVRPEQARLLLPWTLAGLLFAMSIAKSVSLLSLGEEVAVGLGGKTKYIKMAASFAVLILTGSSVAIAGPISFVGLVTPHAVRFLIGSDYRKVLPCSMFAGALLVLFADVVARMVNPPFETPTGAITALIGVPFFIYLAARKGGKG